MDSVTYQVIIPSIWTPYTDACLDTLRADHGSVLVVDNAAPAPNRGVAASWNA
jgi:hypothetical protein